MRIPGLLCTIVLAINLFACNGDDNSPAPLVPIEGGTISVVEAFPQLSFNAPLDLQSPEDGTNRLFVVEQGGLVKVFENNTQATQYGTFLDISNQTNTSSGELGLLGLAFHPQFAGNGFFYVYYTPSPQMAVLSRFKVSGTNPDVADPGSEAILLSISQPYTNHNGGQLAFGPDGFLYIASGDGGSGGDPQGNAQNLNSLLGKILRIDVNQAENGMEYGIPVDNPFSSEAGARPEIYAFGLRNPWRMSFDTQTGMLWAGDVGQGEYEEIDIIEAGGNYGWNIFEGNSCFSGTNCDLGGLTPPVYEYNHSQGDKSVTGGFVYRANGVPFLKGYYVYGDFISGRVWALETGTSQPENILLQETGLSISSFGTDAQGELYLCSFSGSIYRFREEMP